MQLSISSRPPDTNLAALLISANGSPANSPVTARGGGAATGQFAQLFSELANAGDVPVAAAGGSVAGHSSSFENTPQGVLDRESTATMDTAPKLAPSVKGGGESPNAARIASNVLRFDTALSAVGFPVSDNEAISPITSETESDDAEPGERDAPCRPRPAARRNEAAPTWTEFSRPADATDPILVLPILVVDNAVMPEVEFSTFGGVVPAPHPSENDVAPAEPSASESSPVPIAFARTSPEVAMAHAPAMSSPMRRTAVVTPELVSFQGDAHSGSVSEKDAVVRRSFLEVTPEKFDTDPAGVESDSPPAIEDSLRIERASVGRTIASAQPLRPEPDFVPSKQMSFSRAPSPAVAPEAAPPGASARPAVESQLRVGGREIDSASALPVRVVSPEKFSTADPAPSLPVLSRVDVPREEKLVLAESRTTQEPSRVVPDSAPAMLDVTARVSAAFQPRPAPARTVAAVVVPRDEADGELVQPQVRAIASRSDEAKFAERQPLVIADSEQEKNAPPKSFLRAPAKRVAASLGDLGTDVAKPSATMFAGTLSSRSSPVVDVREVQSVVPAVGPSGMLPSAFPASVATVSDAHRAVETVLHVADHFAMRGPQSVNLQFSVGGTELTVRVEMHADEVRATFRTDSPELRAALSHEWQSVASATPDRTARIATPVFTSHDSAAQNAFSGENPSRRDANARRSEPEQLAVSGVRSRAVAAAGAAEPASTVSPLAAPGTSVHLRTLA